MSKELSLSLLEIEKHLKDFVFHFEMGKVDKMFISNSFEIIEKALKALEIIKKYICIKDNKIYTKEWEWELTQEKYDLLKEVLL